MRLPRYLSLSLSASLPVSFAVLPLCHHRSHSLAARHRCLLLTVASRLCCRLALSIVVSLAVSLVALVVSISARSHQCKQ